MRETVSKYGVRLALLLMLVFLPRYGHAQTVSLPIKSPSYHFYFDEVKFPNGSPVRDVLQFVESPDGFIWLGSYHGLLRYDGHDFKVFTHSLKNKNSLLDNYICSLYLQNDTVLYIGSGQGMSVLNLKSYRFTNFSFDDGTCPTELVYSFCPENDTVVWIGGRRGLYRFNPKTARFTDCKVKVPPFTNVVIPFSNEVFCVLHHPFKKNRLLLGTPNGLIGYDKQQGNIYTYPNTQFAKSNPFKHLAVYDIVPDGYNLWFRTWFMGMHRFDLKTETWQNFFPHYYPNGAALGLSSIIVKNKKELWVFDRSDVPNNGLGIFNKETETLHFFKKTQLSANTRLPDNSASLFIQKDSAMWLSYFDGKGLFKQNRKVKRFRALDIPFSRLWVSAFYHDKAENIYYFGMNILSKGIGCWNANTRKWTLIKPLGEMVQSMKLDYPDFSINKFYADSQGNIWVTTPTRGLCYIDKTRRGVKQFLLPNGKPLSALCAVSGIFEDSKKQLWVGAGTEGVFCLNKERNAAVHYVHNANDSTSLQEGSGFSSFEEDRYGKIWVSNRNGFSVFNPETKTFSRAVFNQLRNLGIRAGITYSIKKDTLGRIWMTMPDQGLVRITENPKGKFDFKIYQTENGLKNLIVNHMTRDKNGCFWIVNDGLLYFNPYTEAYMLTDETNGMVENCGGNDEIMVDDYGNVFVSDQVGINWVNEVQKQSKDAVKKLFIEQISVNGNAIDWNKDRNQKIILKHSHNNITFSYTAVCFDETDQIRYRYKLENIEDDWNLPTTLLQARYMQLKPGKYRFMVEVAHKGKWLGQRGFVDFEIRQVFWKSGWFILLILLLVVGIIYGIFRYRLNQYLKLQKLRLKIASDLHDDVGSTLSSISIMSEIANSQIDKSTQASELIQEIGTNAHLMLENMDDIIWSVKPTNDKFQSLEIRIRQYAIPLFETKNIHFRFIIPEALNTLSLTMEVRRNLFLIAKEAVNNLVKYAQCTQADILFTYAHSVLRMEISDNGIGFDTSRDTHRNGLRNMRQRAEEIGGKIDIRSEKNRGTRIILSLKII